MGLLGAVLQEAEQAQLIDVKLKCETLFPQVKETAEKIDSFSTELLNYFTETYVEYSPTKAFLELNFTVKSSKLEEEYSKIITEIDSIDKALIEKLENDELRCSVTELKNKIDLFKQLITTGNYIVKLSEGTNFFHQLKYVEALVTLNDIRKGLNENKEKCLEQIHKGMKTIVNAKYATFAAEVSLHWLKIFSWSEMSTSDYTTYSIQVDHSDIALLQQTVKALHSVNQFTRELLGFARFFETKLIPCIINHQCNIYTDENILKTISFNIKIMKNDHNKPELSSVIENFSALYEFLHATIDKVDSKYIMIETLSKLSQDTFFNFVLKICTDKLKKTTESTISEMISNIKDFNDLLVNIHFTEPQKSPLKPLLSNYNSIIQEKELLDVQFKIKTLLIDPLKRNVITVGSDSADLTNVTFTSSELLQAPYTMLLNKPLYLSNCHITQNVKEAMAVLFECICDEHYTDHKNYIKIVEIIEQSCALFENLGDELQRPDDAAIYFNNCFYIAHCLAGPPWKKVLDKEYAQLLTLATLECIQSVRLAGLERLAIVIQKYKKDVLTLLNINEPITLTYTDFQNMCKSFQQTKSILKELKHIWKGVLLQKMYEKAISDILSGFCDGLFEKLFNIKTLFTEHILIGKLVITIEDFVKELEESFKDLDFKTSVKNWKKLQFITKLLKCLPREFVEVWKKKGECKVLFSSDDMRHIFEAMYNNEYRDLLMLIE